MYSQKKGTTRKKILNLSNIKNKIEYQVINQLIPQKEIEIKEEQSLINIGNKEEIYLNEKNENKNTYTHKNLKKQTFIRVDSQKPISQKARLSNYIYKTEKPFYMNIHSNSNLANDFIRYNTNSKYKYNIKNPVKENSKNKLNKNNSNLDSKHLKLINGIIYNSYIDNNNDHNKIDMNNINVEDVRNINSTFYNLGVNYNTEYIQNAYNKGGKVNLNPKKRQNISFNKRINNSNKNLFYCMPSKRESTIGFIYDYSKEDNKDSYYIESPTWSKHMSAYPLRIENSKKTKGAHVTFKNNNISVNDKIRKKIEESRLKFEKIRQIEKKIKDYFIKNGLKIEDRELYDQSATTIQSVFRGHMSRMKFLKDLKFLDTSIGIDIIRSIFMTRKIKYWDNFLKGILNYLSFIISHNNLGNMNDNYSGNEVFGLHEKKMNKKISGNSYKKKAVKKKNQTINYINEIIPQQCISFNYIKKINKTSIGLSGDKSLEEKYNIILAENDELKKNYEILKNKYEKLLAQSFDNGNKDNIKGDIINVTQKSVELNSLENENKTNSLQEKKMFEKLKQEV